MNLDIAQTIANVIRREERKNEKKIHLVRMFVLALMATLMTISRLVMGESQHETFLVITPASVVYLLFVFFLWRYFAKNGYPSLVSNILTSLDLAYIVITLVGVSRQGQPYGFSGFTVAPPFLIVFLLNALSGLRFNFRASVYAAVASILIIVGLGVYDTYHGYHVTVSAGVFQTLFKAALVGSTALVSGYIGHRSKALIVQAIEEQEEKKFVKRIFGRYATKEVVEDALQRGLKLGGEEKELAILFSDIRNFTSMSEKLQPHEVVDLLNDYFAEMVDIISKNGGTLNKFMGDGILAIFGAPVSYGNNSERAVRTALEMMEKLAKFNGKLAQQGKPTLNIGIGINTGRVVVGNIGSAERMEYTVIGDAVNLASRLEALNKELQTNILISNSTYQQVKNIINANKMQPMQVKGKEKDVWVHEVVQLKQEATA
ncbi:MAG: adenylate/guanylate cyclase domain-containing protein [Anaerolineae bacterium]